MLYIAMEVSREFTICLHVVSYIMGGVEVKLEKISMLATS